MPDRPVRLGGVAHTAEDIAWRRKDWRPRNGPTYAQIGAAARRAPWLSAGSRITSRMSWACPRRRYGVLARTAWHWAFVPGPARSWIDSDGSYSWVHTSRGGPVPAAPLPGSRTGATAAAGEWRQFFARPSPDRPCGVRPPCPVAAQLATRSASASSSPWHRVRLSGPRYCPRPLSRCPAGASKCAVRGRRAVAAAPAPPSCGIPTRPLRSL